MRKLFKAKHQPIRQEHLALAGIFVHSEFYFMFNSRPEGKNTFLSTTNGKKKESIHGMYVSDEKFILTAKTEQDIFDAEYSVFCEKSDSSHPNPHIEGQDDYDSSIDFINAISNHGEYFSPKDFSVEYHGIYLLQEIENPSIISWSKTSNVIHDIKRHRSRNAKDFRIVFFTNDIDEKYLINIIEKSKYLSRINGQKFSISFPENIVERYSELGGIKYLSMSRRHILGLLEL